MSRRTEVWNGAIAALVMTLLSMGRAQADVRLPKILSSHMVLQRDQPIHIWGWSEPGEGVSVAFNGVSQATTADRLGHWNIYLPPQSSGGPFSLVVSGHNRIELEDILLGDVWFASGQSNMEMPLQGFPGAAVKNASQEIASANQPNLRLFFVTHKTSAFPLRDLDTAQTWTTCTPQTAAKFSAVAYFFGRHIAAKESVAIGLIDATWGGTPAEAWVSLDALSRDASLMPVFAAHATMTDEQADIPALTRAEKDEDAAAANNHTAPVKHSWHPDPSSWAPAWLFNGMVSPCINLRIKGVLWYQGESNSPLPRAPLYEKVFSALIADWRNQWDEGEFPFLFVQISSFKSTPIEHWPIIREAQRRTLSVANTAMAVSIDVGNPDNVHPPDKQTVGDRLALAARALAYHENIEYSGPLFRQTSREPGGIRVWFDHVGQGLAANGPVEGFEIAGVDHRFVRAKAQIEGVTVLVSSEEIGKPIYVRYGWQNSPIVNLYNADKLPASPFTSEKNYSITHHPSE